MRKACVPGPGSILRRGIDCDEDGEYAERSAGNYNAVVNNAMLALWQETEMIFTLTVCAGISP